MYDVIIKQLENRSKPIDIIVVGLGFMGFGFVSSVSQIPNIRIPILISRRPEEAVEYLNKNGVKARVAPTSMESIKKIVEKGHICVSSDINLIESYKDAIVFEATGTVAYGTEIALAAIKSGKHIVTMNPELQVTVGSELKRLADTKGIIITDVIGDQPGSLSRLIAQSKMMGFKLLMAGNMKRYLDRHATQEKMKPWADDKGLAVKQTTSFTDGTKQSIEMNLVANYFGLDIIKKGMEGPQVENILEVLNGFDWKNIKKGVVDYVIGRNLFPGVFVVVEHKDPNQKKYLRYLSLGDGPRYVLFDSYHLCHLEAILSIVKVALFGQETINNTARPLTQTVALAKTNLLAGTVLDGIGGDTVYGEINSIKSSKGGLPIGFAQGAKLLRSISADCEIKLSDVALPDNAATRLAGLVKIQAGLRVLQVRKSANKIRLSKKEILHIARRKSKAL